MYYNYGNELKNLVVGTDIKVPLDNGTYITAINMDNAATTPPFYEVIRELNEFYPWYSSIHRGTGYKSQICSDIYENARKEVGDFIGADRVKDVVIFTKNATESINALSHILKEQGDGRDIVLSTWMEHAANDLPWRGKFKVEYIEIDKMGSLKLDDLENKLKKYRNRVKIVTVCGASNVTGYINPIYDIAKIAHKYGTKIMVDAAQLIPHSPFDMKPHDAEEHIDFVAFSAHKMYAPFGAGVLVCPITICEKGTPFLRGGSAIKLVTHERIQWECPAAKDEAGTPNIMGVIALVSAIKVLKYIGMENAFKHEKALYDYCYRCLAGIPGINIYAYDNQEEGRIGVIPFNLERIPHRLLAAMLSYEAGIAVRNGFFCSHPYCQRLLGLTCKNMQIYFDNADEPKPGMVRVSFGIYNNFDEIDRLIYALGFIEANKEAYLKKYTSRLTEYRISNDV